jgi:hypothetical protein
LVAALAVWLLGAPLSAAPPTVKITSPANGAVVNSGQTLVVTVDATPFAFQTVCIEGEDPIGFETLTAPPYEFRVRIPLDIEPGTRRFNACGIIRPGIFNDSDSVTIDIERPDTPRKLSTDLAGLYSDYVGETIWPLSVTGTFPDGTQLSIYHSTLLAYASDNPVVATVATNGIVTTVGVGSAHIVITYAGNTDTAIHIPVTVAEPVTVLPFAVSLNPSQTVQFIAQLSIRPGTDRAVTWSISPQLGSIDGKGLYAAPSSVDSEGSVVVTAALAADPTKSASAQVRLLPPVSISLEPAALTLRAGQTHRFHATVENAGYARVTWSVSPTGAGTIDKTGLYAAPAVVASPQTVTVSATSDADESKTASARVTLRP